MVKFVGIVCKEISFLGFRKGIPQRQEDIKRTRQTLWNKGIPFHCAHAPPPFLASGCLQNRHIAPVHPDADDPTFLLAVRVVGMGEFFSTNENFKFGFIGEMNIDREPVGRGLAPAANKRLLIIKPL